MNSGIDVSRAFCSLASVQLSGKKSSVLTAGLLIAVVVFIPSYIEPYSIMGSNRTRKLKPATRAAGDVPLSFALGGNFLLAS